MRHTTTSSLFQHSLQTTDRWLKEIMTDLGWADRHKAYTALRATLHALREHLPVDECAQLSAQLPLVVRGLYWEGWNPSCGHTDRDFLVLVHAAFKHDPEVDAERVVRAVFGVLAKEVSAGEMEDVRSILPRDVRTLMPLAKGPGEPVSRRPEAAAAAPSIRREAAMLEPGDVGAVRWGA
jgi:uncharacterized protein (DUF2267 family)